MGLDDGLVSDRCFGADALCSVCFACCCMSAGTFSEERNNDSWSFTIIKLFRIWHGITLLFAVDWNDEWQTCVIMLQSKFVGASQEE